MIKVNATQIKKSSSHENCITIVCDNNKNYRFACDKEGFFCVGGDVISRVGRDRLDKAENLSDLIISDLLSEQKSGVAEQFVGFVELSFANKEMNIVIDSEIFDSYLKEAIKKPVLFRQDNAGGLQVPPVDMSRRIDELRDAFGDNDPRCKMTLFNDGVKVLFPDADASLKV